MISDYDRWKIYSGNPYEEDADEFDPIEFYSNCCGEEIKMGTLNYEMSLCPLCGEHCSVTAFDKHGDEREDWRS